MAKLKSPIKWFGGKHYSRTKILPILETVPHTRYVEPFGGGASVLLGKAPVSVETYNDLDGGLYVPLQDAGWRLMSWDTICQAAGRVRGSGLQGSGTVTAKQRRTEALWINPAAQQPETLPLGLDIGHGQPAGNQGSA